MAALERELSAGEEGGGEGDTPEQRRRRFVIIPGSLAGIAAFLGAAPAWASRHGKSAATGLVGAAAGAAVTAAVITHPASAPNTAPAPPYLPPVPVPTASTTPQQTPEQTRPRPRRAHVPSPIIIPSRRRGSSAPTPAAASAPPGSAPSRSTPPAPSPGRSTPVPTSDPSCVVLLEVGRIITVCV